MSTEHKSGSRHKDRRHRSRSRSKDRDSRHHRGAHSHSRHIKTEKITPEREVKKERFSPVERTHRERHSPDKQIKKERPSPDRHHRSKDGGRHDHRPRDNRDSYRHERRQNDDRRMNDKRKRRHEEVDDSKFKYGKPEHEVKEEVAEEDKSKPDYGLSGKLADDTNTYRGVVVKYNEPPEARKPKLKWRLYPFKGETAMPVLHIHRQSGYLLGRDRKVADIPIDHPSCSKQHAVLQFRSVEYTKEDGMKGRRTRPYIIDLGSANGTFVNNKQIESQRYVELLEKDTIKFGFSSRDYVILHDNVDVSPSPPKGVD